MKKLYLFLSFLIAASSLHAQTATINWTITHQTIDGFGAADANNGGTNQEMTTPQLQFFFGTGAGQLGFSILRTRIPNNSTGPDAGNCATVNSACAGTQSTDYAYAVANGIRIYGTPWSPPAAYKSSGTTQCGSLLAGSYANFATWISNWVQSWKSTYNVYPYAMSVQNEPDECGAFTSASYSAAQFDSFIGTNLGPSFSGLPTLIFFPEVENSGSLTSYGGTCMSDSTCAAFIGGVNFHDYHITLTAPDTVSAVPYPATFPATSHYWETEASCPGSNNFCTSTWTPTIANALQWAAVIDQRIAVDNMNAWLWWWFLQDATAPDQEGLMDINTGNAVALRAYAIGQYARFIRPGYIRVDATHQPQTGVSVSAYQGPSNALTIVATNYTASPINQTFNIANAPTFSTLSAYRTSATESIASVTAPSVSGNSFTYSLPAQSITTFVGTGSGGGGGGTTIPLSDCSQGSLSSAWGSMTSGAYTLSFPSCASGGTGNWTAQLHLATPPSAVTSITIQGNTNVNCTGAAGTSSYTCTATDNTVITDSYSGGSCCGNQILTIPAGALASTLFRMTGLTFLGGSAGSNSKSGGAMTITAGSQSIRLDHNHFDATTYSPQITSSWIRLYGPAEGVADHNICHDGLNNTYSWINGCFEEDNNIDDSIGLSDGTWQTASKWGTSSFFFMESNVFNGGASMDCGVGLGSGKYVARYNTYLGNALPLQNHGTKSDDKPWRGCRAEEIYGNYFAIGPNTSNEDSVVSLKSGPALIWGNTVASGYNHFIVLNTDRNGITGDETATPGGWGTCGVTPNGYNSHGGVAGPTAWDGNTNAVGYPCLDGIGRGQTIQSLNGVAQPGRLNSVTGTIAWPQQYLEPVYSFDNTLTVSAMWYTLDSTTTNNRDFYFDCGSLNSTCSGGFTGAFGTGTGSVVPTMNCTAGAGGTYATSPTGSYGVAYWDTAGNGGRGTLYICTATNTWTPVYSPYQYPHPLVSGSPTIGVSFSPTSLNFGSVSLGTTSSPQTITVTNIGTGNLIFGPTGTTNPTGSSFNAAGGTCPISGTLTPASTCTVILQVTANSGSGVMNGTFNFPSNAPGSPQTVPLTVTVVASALSFSPASMNFGSLPLYTTTAPTQGTLTNTGSATLTISSVTTTGIFALAAPMSAPDCRTVGTLAIGASCNFAVSVTPAVAGVATGSVVFVDNAPGQPQSFPLTVTGLQVAPAPTPSFAMAANLAGCKQANPPAPTWCLTGDGHIYFSGCGVATCGPFVPFGLTVAGTAQ